MKRNLLFALGGVGVVFALTAAAIVFIAGRDSAPPGAAASTNSPVIIGRDGTILVQPHDTGAKFTASISNPTNRPPRTADKR